MGNNNPVSSDVFDLVSAIIPTPAAGVDFSFPAPVNARMQIDFIQFILATDATAADRFPTIAGLTPILIAPYGASTVAQPASNTWQWSFVAGLPETQDLSAENTVVIPMGPNIILEPGDNVDSFILNLQAGDTITAIFARFKQWVIA